MRLASLLSSLFSPPHQAGNNVAYPNSNTDERHGEIAQESQSNDTTRRYEERNDFGAR